MGSYDLTGAVKSFSVENIFSTEMSKLAYKLGENIKPFCFVADKFQKESNVIDLITFGGFDNSSITLLDDVVNERISSLSTSGIGFSEVTDDLKKTLFYQYLITMSVCYVEVECWKTRNGSSTPSYDKFLVTRNPALMSAWMGIPQAEAQAKYCKRIAPSSFELSEGTLRFVKLNQSTKGNSITVPRVVYNTKNMKCVPLFMLYAFTEGFKTKLSNGILEFTFLKDNHIERKLCTTLDRSILSEFYNDNTFIDAMLGGTDINTVNQGGMMLSSKQHRGYIKVPELGASIYDSTGTRSLNLSRILAIREISKDDVDTTFIDISLDSVVKNFEESLEYCATKQGIESVRDLYNALLGTEPDSESTLATLISEINNSVQTNELLLSTTYDRQLHMFMVEHPQWFPLYTGKPVRSKVETSSYGVAQLDW